MKKHTLHIGTSSYNNSYWKSVFYPEDLPRSKWFDYYCAHFDTYEINATFYKFPTIKSLKSWYNKAPDSFMFSVKAPKQITHLKKFVDCRTEIEAFYSICHEALDNKLGCVLFQLPPSFAYSPEKLELVLDSLNPNFNNVIEFRNESWWKQEVYEELEKNNIIFCNVSYPKLPDTIIATAAIGYIRLHGDPKLFYSAYRSNYLETLLDAVIKEKKWDEAFIYFNNTASTAGILNAVEMKGLIP